MRKVLLAIVGLSLLGCSQSTSDRLTLAVASNMQFAMEELVQAFERKSGLECEMVVSSSGKLTAQILEGAPFDMLISADLKYPETLNRMGLATGPPATYAYGKLVLWSAGDGLVPSLDKLLSPEIRHIATANPKTAPYGDAAMEVLRHNGLLEDVKDKLVYGESISQVNQFIISGAASTGFTAKSVVLSPQIKETGNWIELDQGHYQPLAQAAIIIDNQNVTRSRQFFDFLFSPEGQEILQQYGYEAVE